MTTSTVYMYTCMYSQKVHSIEGCEDGRTRDGSV